MTPFNQQTMDKLEELRKIHEALSPKEKAHWKEEGRKCLESPLYYYNNYWRKEGDPELSQMEFDAHFEKAYARKRLEEFRNERGIQELLDFNITINK